MSARCKGPQPGLTQVGCSEIETLDAEDKFFCDACQGLQEAQKWLRVQQFPPIFCCHLKRFKYVEELDRWDAGAASSRQGVLCDQTALSHLLV